MTGSLRVLFVFRQAQTVYGVVWMGHKDGQKLTSVFERGSWVCWRGAEQLPLV